MPAEGVSGRSRDSRVREAVTAPAGEPTSVRLAERPRSGRLHDVGYNGGGPHALTAYLTQVVGTDGRNMAAGASYEQAHPAILAWTQNSTADRGANELQRG